MNLIEVFYLSFYFAVCKDKNWSKTVRVKYLINTIFFMLSSSFLFILIGIFNIRTDNLKTITIVIISALLIAHWIGKIFFRKGKEQTFIKAGKGYNLKKKRIFAICGILYFVLSFVIMILSAILMSYLWSFELF
jgi:hypothetical protein